MKHHIEIVLSSPYCKLGSTYGVGGKFIKQEEAPYCRNDDEVYIDEKPCTSFDAQKERNGIRVIGAPCRWFSYAEKRIAFDCNAYEFDFEDGFRSRGREYEIDYISRIMIDGETVFEYKKMEN